MNDIAPQKTKSRDSRGILPFLLLVVVEIILWRMSRAAMNSEWYSVGRLLDLVRALIIPLFVYWIFRRVYGSPVPKIARWLLGGWCIAALILVAIFLIQILIRDQD